MKKTFLLSFFALAAAISLQATEPTREIPIKDKIVDLSKVDATKVRLRVEYPGTISGICGITLKSSLPIDQVLKALNFFDAEPVLVENNRARFNLREELYVDVVKMEVTSGESLKDLLGRMGTTLSARAYYCDVE